MVNFQYEVKEVNFFNIFLCSNEYLKISNPKQDNIEYAKTLEVKEGVRGWKVLEGPEKCTGCAKCIINLL